MKKLAIWVIVVLVILGGIYFAFGNKTKAPTELQKVTISEAFEVFLHAPLWVAYEKGYFKDEGLDVEISIAGGDEKAFAAVLAGEADFAVGDPTFVAVSGEKGQPGTVVASMLNGVAFWGVAKDPKIPVITSPSMLGTYKVATLPAPSTNYALQVKMFQSAGLKPNIKEVQFGGLLPALESGEVDIALEFEPSVSTAVKNGSHIVYSLSEYYPEFAFTGVTTLPEYVKKNPETVQKVVNALQKANTLIINNPKEAAGAITKHYTQIDPVVAEKALINMAQSKVVLPHTRTTKKAWDAAIQPRVDIKDLKSFASFEMYVDNSFAEKAK